MRFRSTISMLLKFLLIFNIGLSANNPDNSNSNINSTFVSEVNLEATDIKNQYKSSTCWSFSTLSLIESELLKNGKGKYDLSEMFIVYNAYLEKAEKYIRLQGRINFAAGGSATDVTDIIDKYGCVPESVYPGVLSKQETHQHKNMDVELKVYVDNIVKSNKDYIPSDWKVGFKQILNKYIGSLPDTFIYKDQLFNPITFRDYLGINSNDYILLTSFNHHPFFESFILEIPDNWAWSAAYNLPLKKFQEVIDSALYKGFSVAWATDISEEGFDFNRGYAFVSDVSSGTTNRQKYASGGKEHQHQNSDFSIINEDETIITQDLRQEAFDSHLTTDDHSMHITGLAFDSNGNKLYYVKNSWGKEGFFNGYMYVTEKYLKFKTISVMIHKDALPAYLKSQLIN